MVWRSGQSLGPAATAFLDMLRRRNGVETQPEPVPPEPSRGAGLPSLASKGVRN